MTTHHARQEAVPMLHKDDKPDLYRLLAVFSGIPMPVLPALVAARLHSGDQREPISDHQRGLLRWLAGQGRIRWVNWGPDGAGYVLTGYGETRLVTYEAQYGPAHAPRRGPPLREVLVHRLLDGFDLTTARSLHAALVAAEMLTAGETATRAHGDLLVLLAARGHVARAGDGYTRTELGELALDAHQKATRGRP
ncbi:hypothetical protein GO986_08955 [Deinococcus sp. HMF7620]|uniref:Uncharacterized protein n=1 Tax=Deinococcus arboris TaxID=2682977 RepID=A0A7C9HRI9_9DEIO|nr:hypothetical protein [Deinococcus arboris]MVN86892.1 hypothetical protein [Deinococcus arboris]